MFVLITTIIAFVLLVIIMQINTNGLMSDIRTAFLSSDYYIDADRYKEYPELYNNPNVNYVLYSRDEQRYDINQWFNRSGSYQGKNHENVNIDLKLSRHITFHNFSDGYLWFHYFVYYKDKEGNNISGGGTSENYPVKVKIHKENGEWQVVQIWERP